MADDSAATSKAPQAQPNAADDRENRTMRGDSASWMQKITPAATEQVHDVNRDIPSAQDNLSAASMLMDAAMATKTPTESSSAAAGSKSKSSSTKQTGVVATLLSGLSKKGGNNSKGRSTATTLQKAASDVKKIKNPEKAVTKAASKELEK